MRIVMIFILLFLSGALMAQTHNGNKKPSDAEMKKMIEKAKRDTEIEIGSSKDQPGLGPNDGEPLGKPFVLPPCVKLVDRPNKKFIPDPKQLYGFSNTFYVGFSFVNTCCNKSIDVNLPPGMMITSDDGSVQNGLLVENVYFTIPPNNCDGKKDTITIYLALVCLNEQKSPPVGRHNPDYNIDNGEYKIGKVTTDPNLLKLLALLEKKPGLRTKQFITNDPDRIPETELEKMHSEIQLAIYKITDGRGLTRAEVDKLKKQLEKFNK